MLISAPGFAAETPLLAKVTNMIGCEGWVRAEPLPDRKPVMFQLRNLASRITLLAQLVPASQFNVLTGTNPQDLDTRLAEIAENLLDTNPNAIKPEDLQEQLDNIEARIMDSLNKEQKNIVTAADVHPKGAGFEVNAPTTSSEYNRPPGFKQYGPGQAKP